MVRCVPFLGALSLMALLSFVGTPALSGTATFTGTLTIVAGGGSSGLSLNESVNGGGLGSYNTSALSFTLPTAAFVTNRSTPIGFTSNASVNSLYTIRSILNQSSGAGSFAAGAGPVGGFGGIMNAGLDVTLEIGIVPLPNVFGSVVIPVQAGVPGTAVAVGNVGGFGVTVSVVGTGWTTGTITVSDQTVSAPTATIATNLTAVGSNNLGASGGQITLVTPYIVRIRGAAPTENRAGYATLSLNFSVPEPGTAWLLALASGASVVAGHRSRRGRRLSASPSKNTD